MSCDDAVIEARALAKTYLLYPSPRHRLMQFLWRGRKQFYAPVEALKPLDIAIGRGETVGIVGRNGSGKSTLLQLLCGTLSPTGGTLEMRGRVAALLELGAGFHPDFTGRENVYLSGAIMGFSRREMDARLGAIAAFANIGEFIDRPVSAYSSGMTVRLAFAAAVSADPDILVVDEALAVGDESFQRKCFARLHEMKRRGVTILFVSHAAQAVIDLCDRALLLDGGELLADGGPRDVITRYHRLVYAPPAQRPRIREEIRRNASPLPDSPRDPGPGAEGPGAEEETGREGFDPALVSESAVEYPSDGGRIARPLLLTESGQPVNLLAQGGRYRLRYRLELEEAAEELRCGMLIKTRRGAEAAGAVLHEREREAGTVEVEFSFHCLLNPDLYFLSCGATRLRAGEERYIHRRVDALAFRVIRGGNFGGNVGITPAGLVDLQFCGAIGESDA